LTTEEPALDLQQEKVIFLFSAASTPPPEATLPPIQLVPGTLSRTLKRPGHESDHIPPSSAEVKNAWHYTSTDLQVLMTWCLIKQRDSFTFKPLEETFEFRYIFTGFISDAFVIILACSPVK
jgi:hypothetical protein